MLRDRQVANSLVQSRPPGAEYDAGDGTHKTGDRAGNSAPKPDRRFRPSFPALRKLDIGSNRYITDDALMSVGKIATLVEVRPPHQLSDGAMRNLHGLKQLRVLDLRDSECSEAALNELRRELPECQLLRAD